MHTLIKIGTAMLALAVVLIAASFGVMRAQAVGAGVLHGNRMLSSETRAAGAGVTEIDLNGPIDLELKQGAVPALTVFAEQDMLPQIATRQEGDALHIDAHGMLFHIDQPMRVVLTLPNVQKLSLRGSGNGEVSGFSGDKLALDLQGSGDLQLNGQYRQVSANLLGSGELALELGNADEVDLSLLGSGGISASGVSKSLHAHLRGSGNLDTKKLQADAVDLQVAGSGNATVFARQSVAISVAGSGDAMVYGNPGQRQVSRAGSGEVAWANQ